MSESTSTVQGSEGRTRARQLAMQALCQLDVQGPDVMESMEEFFVENESDPVIRKLARQWCRGAWDNHGMCDQLIGAAARQWKLDRICLVDRNVLRLAVYQLACCQDIPPIAAINEAIELARAYSTEQSPGFVNGVLDAVRKQLLHERQDASVES